MKLQSPTFILVFIAIALGSFVAVTELRPTDSSDGSGSQSLFEFEEKEVRSLVVETAFRTLIFEKDLEVSEADTPETKTFEADAKESNSENPDTQNPDTEASSSTQENADAASKSEATEEEAKESRANDSNSDVDTSDADSESASESDDKDTGEATAETSADPQEDGDAGNQPETISEWWMRSPDEAPADDSAVLFLVNLMASGVSDRVFDVAPENLDDFGFDSPLAEVEVTLDNNESHRLILGNYDFNGTNIYAQTISTLDDSEAENSEAENSEADTESTENETESSEAENSEAENSEAENSETVEVFIVPTSFDAAVNRPLDEWKHVEDNNAEEDADASEDDPS